jgi:LemA protein
MISLIPIFVVLAMVAMPLLWLIINYNRFTGVVQHMHESWSDIDVEMKRRYDLIPNLVKTVKGFAAHEKSVLEEVVELRNQAMANHGTATEQAVDETALAIGMKKLFAVVEAYPQLRSDTHFLALQQELANTEDRIAAARRFYNGNVRDLNQLCDQVPTNLIAGMFNFQKATYFQLSSDAERVVPRVAV